MSRNQRAGVGGPLSRATKGIGSLIGLATEAHAHHKEKKAAEQRTATTEDAATHNTSQDTHIDDEDPDEEDWALDDASIELSPDSFYVDGQMSSKGPMSSISEAGPPPYSTKPLPYPVILPQRRPQSKSRGFVRAYAPILGECKGIDQATFLNFLDEFYKSSQVCGDPLVPFSSFQPIPMKR